MLKRRIERIIAMQMKDSAVRYTTGTVDGLKSSGWVFRHSGACVCAESSGGCEELTMEHLMSEGIQHYSMYRGIKHWLYKLLVKTKSESENTIAMQMKDSLYDTRLRTFHGLKTALIGVDLRSYSI